MTVGFLVPNVFLTGEFLNLSLGYALQAHFLNKLIYTQIYGLHPLSQYFLIYPTFCLWVLYRNWLLPLNQFSILCPIFLNVGHWNAYVSPIRILKDLLGSSLDIKFSGMLQPLFNVFFKSTLLINDRII